MTPDQANRALRPAVTVWAYAGLIGVPLAVYFDLLGGWRWPPYNAVYDQMIVSIYVAVGICATLAIQKSFAARKLPLVCGDIELNTRLRDAVSRAA